MLAFVIGILLLLSPLKTVTVLVQLIGLYLLIAGILSLVNIFLDRSNWGWTLGSGLIGIIAGIIVIHDPLWTTFLVPATAIFYLAILAIIHGIVQIIQDIKSADLGVAAMGFITFFLSIILFLATPLLTIALPLMLGFLGIIGGILLVIVAFILRHNESAAQLQPGPPGGRIILIHPVRLDTHLYSASDLIITD